MLLSESERRLYDYLQDFIAHHRYSPTIREIKLALEESSSSFVQNLLDRLQSKGYIDRQQGLARTISLLYSELPLHGVIQAGFLTEHPECCDRIRLEGKRYLPGDYALKIAGDSMIDAQILDGDIVVIRPTGDLWAIRPGQIAVVWIEGDGATLKHIYYAEDDPAITMAPANGSHPSRTLDRPQVGVQGVMVGLHRHDNGLWIVADEETPHCETPHGRD